MGLPDPLRLPASLQANQRAEAERAARLRLPGRAPAEETVTVALSPIRASSYDAFEELFLRLRRQNRKLARYQLLDAALASLAGEDVQERVIAELIRQLNSGAGEGSPR